LALFVFNEREIRAEKQYDQFMAGKMDWDKARLHGKERTQGIEYTGRRRRFRPWVTESSIEEEDLAAEAEFVPHRPVSREELDKLIASLDD
jgi:hypothetical protein